MAAPSRRLVASGKLAEARSLARAGRLHEAAWAYAELVEAKPGDAACWLEYGVTLAQLDDHPAAVEAFEQALSQRPGWIAAWNDCGVSLIALGRPAEARVAFERAVQLQPSFAAATSNLASLELGAGNDQRAEWLFRRALQHSPRHGAARIGLGRALSALGRNVEAAVELERALSQEPACFDALLASVAFYMRQGRAALAANVCDRFLQISPHHSGGLGLRAELARERGDAAALELLDFERWVRIRDLQLDPALLVQLSAVLATHPSLVRSPPHHATRNGRHSAALSGLEHESLAELEPLIESELRGYVVEQAARTWWPRPASVALHTWAVVMEAEGFQLPHLHPDAWLSGVFYVAVPDLGDPLGASQAGCLEFGRVDAELGFSRTRSTRLVTPKPGRMVIFPSWLYHSTIAHGRAASRISVAFDCVRA